MTSATTRGHDRLRSTAEQATQRLRFGFGRKLPLVLQADPSESGLACLAMVAGFHGHLTDMSTLRARFVMSLSTMNAKTVVDIGAALHLQSRSTRVDHKQLGRLKLPCILHWDMNHFVVLKRVRPDGGIVIHDPAAGEERVKPAELARRFTDITALEFKPGPGFQSQDLRRPAGLGWLLGKVTGLKRSLLQIAMLALSLQVFALATPLFMQWVVDSGVATGDRDLVQLLAAGFVLLVLAQVAIGLMRSWVVLYMVSHINLQWLSNTFTHMLRLPASYFERRQLGEVASRFQSIHTMQGTLGTGFVEGAVDGVMALTLLAVMFFYSVPLTLVVVAAAGLYAALRWAFYPSQRRATEQQLVLASKEQALFMESVQNMQAIKLFNHEPERRARWLDAVVDSMNRLLVTQKISLGLHSFKTLLMGVETVAVVWLAAGLAMDNSLSLGMLFAFASYKTTFSQRFYALIDKLVDLQMMRLQGDRVGDIVRAQAERSSGVSNANRKKLPEDATLEVRGLWFRYADELPWVLQDVNIVFQAGEAAAIVGASGCGKTTLVKLMLGLLQPTRGSILFGGVPIESLGNRAYRKLIGAVMQEDQLLAGSLIDNISFFTERANMERVLASSNTASIHDEIERMPMGYHTLVGGMGISLSSGQKQRLLLARALYKRPKLLFLDEATSHVDAKRENLINEALRPLPITRIIVAHRAEAIRGIPRVIVIENGTVAKDLSSVIVNVTDTMPANHRNENFPVLNNVLSLR
ncbi:MAG: peptidase domain-containing ABC transporter [Cytophagales bacterium]|nr:peptidase domain-containing ABC transporter [Rhizobacter sp.]